MARPKHPKKDIEEAIKIAEGKGWEVSISKKGHAWGRIFCPDGTTQGCKMSIYSTPKNPSNFAKRIIKYINACDHNGKKELTHARI